LAAEKGDARANGKNDESGMSHINELAREGERLYAQKELTLDDQQRLSSLKVQLDQCWDLLRQTRALRECEEDPDKAKVRSKKVVENYER
jgi:Protein of unknown function (DUF2630)